MDVDSSLSGQNGKRLGPSPDDAALIRGFLAGDEQSFRLLYRRHAIRLRQVVLRLMGPREADVDDVIQETWLAACRSLSAFRGDAQFSTWLTTIGIRTARARLNIAEAPNHDGLHEPEADVQPIAEGIDVERLLARLSDQHRAVLVLHDIEGFTHEEIGRQLGVATGTSKATLSRARATLRRYLNGEVTDGRT
jgi:RNA polymerase sigma factor (sigma-70 family)